MQHRNLILSVSTIIVTSISLSLFTSNTVSADNTGDSQTLKISTLTNAKYHRGSPSHSKSHAKTNKHKEKH